MLAIIIYLNYFHPKLLYFTGNKGGFIGFIQYYCLYLLPYGIAFLLQLPFCKDNSFIRNRWFWIIIFIAPAIFSFRVNFSLHHILINRLADENQRLFWVHCSKWFTGLFTALIPVYCIWKIKDSKKIPFYGTGPMGNTRPYLLLVTCMIPLIVLAATQADFLKMYPRAKVVETWNLHPRYLYYALHEFFYSLDFITIEFFFRGFLIISMISICGRQCIIPAAAFYCCIHLGKPMGEAISSFAGGILLGIVSSNTRTVKGGLLVHLGIAWLMEIAGFIAAGL